MLLLFSLLDLQPGGFLRHRPVRTCWNCSPWGHSWLPSFWNSLFTWVSEHHPGPAPHLLQDSTLLSDLCWHLLFSWVFGCQGPLVYEFNLRALNQSAGSPQCAFTAQPTALDSRLTALIAFSTLLLGFLNWTPNLPHKLPHFPGAKIYSSRVMVKMYNFWNLMFLVRGKSTW